MPEIRTFYIANAPFFVFNTPCNVSLSYRLTSKILPKHTRFALQMLCKYTRVWCKYAHNSQMRQFYVFNTPHNVPLSRHYTSQILQDTSFVA